MRDGDDGAPEVGQGALQPGDGQGVQMVRGLGRGRGRVVGGWTGRRGATRCALSCTLPSIPFPFLTDLVQQQDVGRLQQDAG